MEKSLKTHPQIIVDTIIIIIITFLMQNSGVAELCVWNPRYLRARSLFFLCLELTKTLVVTKVNFLRSRTNRQQQRCRRRVYNLFRKKNDMAPDMYGPNVQNVTIWWATRFCFCQKLLKNVKSSWDPIRIVSSKDVTVWVYTYEFDLKNTLKWIMWHPIKRWPAWFFSDQTLLIA